MKITCFDLNTWFCHHKCVSKMSGCLVKNTCFSLYKCLDGDYFQQVFSVAALQMPCLAVSPPLFLLPRMGEYTYSITLVFILEIYDINHVMQKHTIATLYSSNRAEWKTVLVLLILWHNLLLADGVGHSSKASKVRWFANCCFKFKDEARWL